MPALCVGLLEYILWWFKCEKLQAYKTDLIVPYKNKKKLSYKMHFGFQRGKLNDESRVSGSVLSLMLAVGISNKFCKNITSS